MHELPYEQNPQWKEILALLSKIRSENDYAQAHVEFIREQLTSFDDRIRGGAALAAEGCLFEPYILDLVIDIAENDGNAAIRKAALQSLGAVIHEGVMQGMEDEQGAGTGMDDAEEWEEFQSGGLKDDYQRVKNLLFTLLEDEEEPELQQLALSGLSSLGFLEEVREKIGEFYDSGRTSAQLVALHAMGKFPQFWIDQLASLIRSDAPPALLKEAISASYSSQSPRLAQAIEGVLDHRDSEVLRYALMTLANLNLSENLGEILQRFSLHENSAIQEAAKDGIELINQKNFQKYMEEDLGMDPEG